MKLGISSYTFGWAITGDASHRAMDENDLLGRARDFGVSLLQIGDNLPLHTWSEVRLNVLRERVAGENIALEVGARKLTSENVAIYIDIARHLDAKILRFVIDAPDYEPAPEVVISILREIKNELSDVTLGIENHDRFGARTLRDIIEKVGSERVGICLDTANSLGAGEGLNEVVKVLSPVTVNLHIKDFHIGRVPYLMGFVVEGRPAGQGMMNLPAVLESEFERCHTAILELWVPPETDFGATLAKEEAWAQQSLQYLRSLPNFVL